MSMMDVEGDDDGKLLRVSGEVDADSVPTLKAALATAAPDVRLDMTECTFFDSMGVSSLVDARAGANPGLTIVAMSRRVERVLTLCDLLNDLAPEHQPSSD